MDSGGERARRGGGFLAAARRAALRPRPPEPDTPARQAVPGLFLGGLLGGIGGWLVGIGALPHPALLPLKEATPTILALALAGGGLLLGGASGALADALGRAARPTSAAGDDPDEGARREG